jgi:DNA-binding FrmR family transcriptional regulator
MKPETKPKLLNRLNRIEGRVRGIVCMVGEDRYCIDVLTQLRAVQAALSRVETEMLKDHLETCVQGAIVGGDADRRRKMAAELIALLERTAR